MTKISMYVIVRTASEEDLDAVVQVEQLSWPPGTRASRDQFIERLEVFPDGFLLAETGGQLLGVLTSQLVDYHPDNRPLGWGKATNDGWIRATHKPEGNSLYIVSIGVAAEYQRKGVGTVLMQTVKKCASMKGLQYLILNSRLPGFLSNQPSMTIDEYVFATLAESVPLDPELRFYRRLGFEILSPSCIITSMSNDLESAGYGVQMVCSL